MWSSNLVAILTSPDDEKTSTTSAFGLSCLGASYDLFSTLFSVFGVAVSAGFSAGLSVLLLPWKRSSSFGYFTP